MIRNVLICTTQVPFTTGGAEAHVAGLQRALIAAGYNAEVVALPFKWYPPSEIMRSALAWRLLDLSEANGKPVDLVIGMTFLWCSTRYAGNLIPITRSTGVPLGSLKSSSRQANALRMISEGGYHLKGSATTSAL